MSLLKVFHFIQNFCLFELFNPEQMLELMGRLRGVPAFELGSHVNQWLEIFGST